MKYYFLTAFVFFTHFAQCQTYSKVLSDSEILSFINYDIQNDSSKATKVIRRKMFSLSLENFYYKDSADFIKKNENSQFIFRYHILKSREYTNHLDTLFSRKDIDFFYKQIMGQRERKAWYKPFLNSYLADNVELDSNRYAKQIMYSYSLPLFSFDKSRVIIIKGFYCGFLCGGGAYYIYEKDKKNNWKLIRELNEWGE